MSWQTITLRVPAELREAIVGEFSSDGIAGVWERDLEGEDAVQFVVYFEPGKDVPLVRARVGRVFERNGFRAPSIDVGRQEKEDWTLEWRKGFTSFPVGRRFRVIPSWEKPPSGEDRIPIRIDPGLAFGTGAHETTQLMIEELEELQPGPGPVLDLGTGSAILVIAARNLGHPAVLGCDIDGDAVQVARDNLRRNACDAPVFVGSIDAVAPASFALVLANLTADVIRDVIPSVAQSLRHNGTAVLSGILDVQAAAVRGEVERTGLRVSRLRSLREWVVMVASR